RPLLAEALQLLGTQRALVVQGEDGLDEVTLDGPTRVTEVSADGLRNFSWTPADFGLAPSKRDKLLIDGAQASAELIRSVLSGTPGPARDIVVINAAAALWVAGKSASPAACAVLAASAIDSGAASALLEQLVLLSNA